MAKLIILRGPAGSGKSTVAKMLHGRLLNKTALMEQDYYRHQMFNNPHDDIEAPRQVMFASIAAALNNGYDVIVEGIMSVGQYSPYFDKLFVTHPNDNYWFYMDVSFETVLARHVARDKRDLFGEEQLRVLYNRASLSGRADEQTIAETLTAEQACELVAKAADLPLSNK